MEAAKEAGTNGNGSAPPDFGLPSFADMSSQQRSASMDNIAHQVEGLTRQVNALTAASAQHTRELLAHQRRLNVHGDDLSRDAAVVRVFVARSFWQRLRWLVNGR